MLSWAFTFLVIAAVSGTVGLSGVAGAATQFAWILSMIALIGALILFIGSHRPRVF